MAQTSDGPSWASQAAKGSLQKLSKNVMEIFLEKDVKGVFTASDSETARVLQKLGVDVSSHIEMVQICPLRKNVIQVTLKDDMNIDRFVNKEAFEVKAGVRVSHVRAAGQREVTLLVKGLHPQTPHSRVFEYLVWGRFRKLRYSWIPIKKGHSLDCRTETGDITLNSFQIFQLVLYTLWKDKK